MGAPYIKAPVVLVFKTSNSNKCLRCWYKCLPVITQDKQHTDLPLIEIKH